MSSMLPRIAALGAAYFGFTMFRDNMRHVRDETNIHINHMIEHDYMEHTLHSMHDYSGNTTMTNWKHWLLNPANFHFIKQPMMWAQSTAGMMWDNAVPLGLSFLGLTWGFGGSVIGTRANPGVLSVAARGLGWGGQIAGRVLGQVGGAIRQVAGPALVNAWQNLPRIQLNARGVLGLAAAAGVALYGAHMFKRELSGEAREEVINYLNPPH